VADAGVTVETASQWQAQGQYWRREALITEERQAELGRRTAIAADIAAGIYPFRDVNGERIRLARDDVEWLLTEHGPIFWEDQASRWRAGVDLRGADLSGVDLSGLPMARCILGLSFDDRTAITNLARSGDETKQLLERATCCLERANLFRTHLEGAQLGGAYLGGARLRDTHLEGAFLRDARFVLLTKRSAGNDAQWYRRLTNVRLCHFDESTSLNDIVLRNSWGESARLADVRWNGVNVSVIDWEHLRLGDEILAARFRRRPAPYAPEDGLPVDRIDAYKIAVRGNRQVATMLRTQGLNELADTFSYQAHRCQRHLYRLRWRTAWGRYVTSWFMDVLAGYGYRPGRAVLLYFSVIVWFANFYTWTTHGVLTFGLPPSGFQPLAWYEALVLSISSFHGRGFLPFPNLGDPVTILAAIEAVFGLVIEISFIATFTQRFFGAK
jgi:uncharacterized protein YjbI with pentapeptide repeats